MTCLVLSSGTAGGAARRFGQLGGWPQYTRPGGSLVRVMEPSGQAPLRASFTNANGGPISPFTGKPVQPPQGFTKSERVEFIRSRTHVGLGE